MVVLRGDAVVYESDTPVDGRFECTGCLASNVMMRSADRAGES